MRNTFFPKSYLFQIVFVTELTKEKCFQVLKSLNIQPFLHLIICINCIYAETEIQYFLQ